MEDGSEDRESDEECWQLAYAISGFSNESRFQDDWRVNGDEWLQNIAAQSFATIDYLQPFYDEYNAVWQGRTGVNSRVKPHPVVNPSVRLPGQDMLANSMVAKDTAACLDGFLDCGNVLGDISVASGSVALGCAVTGNAPCVFVAGTVSSVSGTGSTAITMFNALNNIFSGQGTARDYTDITVGVATTAAPPILKRGSTGEVYGQAVDLAANSISRFTVPQKQ